MSLKTFKISDLPNIKESEIDNNDLLLLSDAKDGNGLKFTSKNISIEQVMNTVSNNVKDPDSNISKSIGNKINNAISLSVDNSVDSKFDRETGKDGRITNMISSQVETSLSAMIFNCGDSKETTV